MENQEDKGFVFKDKRKIRLEDIEADTNEQPTLKAQDEQKAKTDYEKSSEQFSKQEETQLPKVTFSTFVFSLASSALMHLGEVPDPVSKKTSTNLSMARQIIDTLAIIEEKTKGNLTKDEENLLKSLLYDLRLKFVQKSSKK